MKNVNYFFKKRDCKEPLEKEKLKGIDVIEIEESYTSKCSFFDNEYPCKHENYQGQRVKRGLFKTSLGKTLNADLNGALNIIKK